MILIAINKTVALKRIPGFDRLSELVSLIVGIMLIAYLLQKKFFWNLFLLEIELA